MDQTADARTRTVRVVSHKGVVVSGTASLSVGRGKTSVAVYFNPPIWVPYGRDTKDGYWASGEEFYLTEHDRAILVWGQGDQYPRGTWFLDPNDAAEIIATGGG